VSVDKCEACGQVVIPDRLARTEAAVAVMDETERLEVRGWIVAALRRPPLLGANRQGSPFAGIYLVLTALADDLFYRLVDPLAPVVEGLGAIWQPHPRALDQDAGIEYHQVEPGVTERRVVDGWGIEGT
jgi:hypothetical protein